MSNLCDFFLAVQGRLVVSSHESARELKGTGICNCDRRGDRGLCDFERSKRKVTVEIRLCLELCDRQIGLVVKNFFLFVIDGGHQHSGRRERAQRSFVIGERLLVSTLIDRSTASLSRDWQSRTITRNAREVQ